MRTYKYVRVSTTEQNPERQGDFDFMDKISGSVPFNERPEAKKLLQLVDKGQVDEVRVHSIDRLGRNTLDILQTIRYFTSCGVNVVSEKEGLSTLQPNGKENPIAKMIIGILGTLSEFELERIKERQREGIAKAKERGGYDGNGRPKGTTISQEAFLNKRSSAECIKYINQGYSLRKSALLSKISLGTAVKVKKALENI